MIDVNPISVFEHDHAELNREVLELGSLLAALDGAAAVGPGLAERFAALRDDLFMHFVREEEGLFPFVSTAVPDLAQEVAELIAMHDEICGAVARMVHAAQVGSTAAVVRAIFERFETAHARHAVTERSVLHRIGGRLTPAQAGELAELIRGL
ncbi:MAG TPA: hemerythrin domain-containing protein [Kofleriaceae bacterium]|jgi:hypothetical protein|nr:hemerythrin domain-containing protein [Kofleriaceae bacterium]